jgi:MFS transporter, ACS family, glucarate transporter
MVAADMPLSVVQLSFVHTAFLAGYLLGHLPAGVLADRIGGYKVLCLGGFGWSAITLSHAWLAHCPIDFAVVVLGLLRFLVGLMTAAAVPGLAATLAQGLSKVTRTKAMSTCYGA